MAKRWLVGGWSWTWATARAWLGRADLILLIGALVVAGGTWGFLELADEVGEGDVRRFDEAVLRALRDPADPADALGPHWLEEAARDVTALGGFAVLVLAVAAVVGYQLLGRHYAAAGLVLAAAVGGVLLSSALKELYGRPRPDVVPHLARVSTASFPSGHAMLTAVVYLTLGALLARLSAHRWQKLYVVAVALLLSVLVGATRVYLGVHYPTDVLAGWAAGLAWAVLCWLAARYLQRRGAVEGDAE
jgi:undecaprenyl-diphosphatase